MGVKQFVRAKLPVCGDCVNCKVVVWKDAKGLEADKFFTRLGRNDGLETEEPTGYFLVRCAWLKNAVMHPLLLEGCEGKKSYKDEQQEE